MASSTNCYDLPQYWDLSFDEDTQLEADFIQAAAAKYCDFPVTRLLEPGCGGGRLVVELGRRGLAVTGWDLSQTAADYGNQRLALKSLPGRIDVQDMRKGTLAEPADLAYCLVNTFRHLLTEDDAVGHLKTVAECLKPGGLYIIGMHLLPPDADEEDNEEWSVTSEDTTVDMRLDVAGCDRITRLETLRFEMTVTAPSFENPQCFESSYDMRIYEATDMVNLIAAVPEFELLSEVYDFWYDIEDPLTLSDEMGDTVFILRRV